MSKAGVWTIAALACAFSGVYSGVASAAPFTYSAELGADAWWGSNKIDNTRRGTDFAPVLHFKFEHSLPYLPNANIRYTSVDGSDTSFYKTDYSFYYNLLTTHVLHFDAGVTLTNYTGSSYHNRETDQYFGFNDVAFNWYGDAAITVPNSRFDIIGQIQFGDSRGLKGADMTVGVQYHVPINTVDMALRGGYRIIDLEYSADSKIDSGAKIFVDGWFMGAMLSF